MIRNGNVQVGDKAPDFALTDQTGKTVKLSKFQGIFGKPVVLYFYPSDGSPGCTKQAAAFTQSYDAFKKAGAVVLGVSGDDVDSHVKFIGDQQIPFQLLADEGNKVRQQYGVKKDLLGLLEGRETYVIGKDGTVKLVYNNQFGPESHIEKALEALSS
ncbi:hypothetical protein CVIRNUC_010629 [Coccomyxa viridis]|uniref:thioredoxin-dependent peroxiredoxin n=1 Tax=Coccomyxa viridis TaxID=1274662 RepID=A0AAV1IJ94_9CHLO|nr:hypothetical protein CVIRNUC_010629 [Coccomyxa viridis]